MTNSSNLISIIKPTMATAGAAVMSFVGPVLPYGWICTAMVAADFISARMLRGESESVSAHFRLRI